mgnify:CR=1 FL=1
MTYKEWENCLVAELKGLPTAECLKITDYYKEMYGDRLDAGMSEEDILTEFGSPKACAEKILAENTAESGERKSTPAPKAPSNAAQKTKGIILAVLFSIFAGIPLAAVLLSIVVALGAVCISGTAGIVASLVYLFIGPFTATGVGIAAHIGMAIGAIGVCGFLGLGGYYATKYSAVYSYKLMKLIYGGILK